MNHLFAAVSVVIAVELSALMLVVFDMVKGVINDPSNQ